jgi:hypothetical protein
MLATALLALERGDRERREAELARVELLALDERRQAAIVAGTAERELSLSPEWSEILAAKLEALTERDRERGAGGGEEPDDA